MVDKLFCLTEEGILVDVPADQYENGFLIFSSIEGRKIGKLKVTNYRELKKKPYQEPLNYLFQSANCLRITWNLFAKIFLRSPIVYFWLLIVVAAYGAVDFKTLSLEALYSPPLLQISIMIVAIPFFFRAVVQRYLPGYRNIFKERFHRLLDQNIPGLREVDKYKLSWVKG